LLFKDGAIVGIDLPGMARNAKAAFGLSEKTEERPKTDFSELHAPFTIKDGVVDTRDTTMASPLLRLKAAGKSDLVEESLDFRVEPTFVATLKGQGDAAERSGIRVPILVSGTFSSPKFRPDLEGMVKERIKDGLPDAESVKEMLSPGEKTGEEEQDIEEKAKGLLKGLMGN
ncbi:MAG: AsmA-like C-terminal region-containing protein, partial [Desulfobacteraceae bacterium]